MATWLLNSTPLIFTPPESSPSGQFWGIYTFIGGVRVNKLNKHPFILCLTLSVIHMTATAGKTISNQEHMKSWTMKCSFSISALTHTEQCRGVKEFPTNSFFLSFSMSNSTQLSWPKSNKNIPYSWHHKFKNDFITDKLLKQHYPGASIPPKPMTHIPPISAKFINSSYFRSFLFFCASSLLWPWCIYASCLTRIGCLWRYCMIKCSTPVCIPIHSHTTGQASQTVHFAVQPDCQGHASPKKVLTQ